MHSDQDLLAFPRSTTLTRIKFHSGRDRLPDENLHSDRSSRTVSARPQQQGWLVGRASQSTKSRQRQQSAAYQRRRSRFPACEFDAKKKVITACGKCSV